jgi:hypothetical protein
LQDLMNPETERPRPGKRRFSATSLSPIIDEDDLEALFDLDDPILVQGTYKHIRLNNKPHTQKVRTRREPRMRRRRSSTWKSTCHASKESWCQTETGHRSLLS